MPRIFLLILICLNLQLNAQALKPYPSNFNPDSLKLAAAAPRKWQGKIVAFEAVINEKYRAQGEHRYLLMGLPGTANIWVGTIAKDDPKIIYEGAHVKVLGYFDLVDDKMAAELNKTGYHILAIAIVNLDTKQVTSHEEAKKQVEIWEKGTMPKAQAE